jgi:hypothetical protein
MVSMIATMAIANSSDRSENCGRLLSSGGTLKVAVAIATLYCDNPNPTNHHRKDLAIGNFQVRGPYGLVATICVQVGQLGGLDVLHSGGPHVASGGV